MVGLVKAAGQGDFGLAAGIWTQAPVCNRQTLARQLSVVINCKLVATLAADSLEGALGDGWRAAATVPIAESPSGNTDIF